MSNHLIEAEQAVLGAILKNNAALDAIADVLLPEDFYHGSHSAIYRAAIKLVNNAVCADPFTLASELDADGLLESIGGITYLGELIEAPCTPQAARNYALAVLEKSAMRKIAELSEKMAVATTSTMRSNEIIEEIQAEVQRLADRKSSLEKGFKTMKQLVVENIDDLQRAHENYCDGKISGLSTGLIDLDEMLGGLQNSDLIVVAGRPSSGKTSLAMNMVEHIGLNLKENVAVFSLEMADKSLSKRMLCSVSRVESDKARRGNFDDKDFEKLSAGMGKLDLETIMIDDSPALTVQQITSKSKRLKARVGKLSAIVIDYLGLMGVSSTSKTETRATQVAGITAGLKKLAKELNIPVVILSQLNRNLEARPNKRPMPSDLKESGAIEQDADVLLMVYRDEMYNPDTPDKGIAEIIVAKQRDGRVGTVRAAYIGEYTRFENLSRRGE